MDRDITIFIKDSPVKWIAGQVYRISFSNGLDLKNTNGNFNMVIYTDSVDSSDNGFNYSVEVGIIPWQEFENKNNKPIIEIICIDPDNFDFDIDIF